MSQDKRQRSIDEEIAAALRAAEQSGELRTAKSYGKPLDLGDGYHETPADLRMAMKVLKDAGYAPPEVEMFNEIARMRATLRTLESGSSEHEKLKRAIHDLELNIRLRLERLTAKRP
jgi:hypothetical protein